MADLGQDARAAAHHCLQDWARLQPGEQVLLLRDDGNYVEEGVVSAFQDAARELGGEFSEARCAIFNPRTEDPPLPVQRALESTDVVLFFSPYPALIHSRSGRRAMLEHGLRNVPILTPTVAALASPWARFPVQLQLLLHNKCVDAAMRSRHVRVTSRQGTDIAGLAPLTVTTTQRDRLFHGLCWHGIWPGECGPPLQPMAEMNGRLVVDVLPGFKGFLPEKIVVEVRDNRIHSISGGAEARWFRSFVDEHLAKGADADVLFELQWGLNPKGDIYRALETTDRDEVEISRMARTIHFGFGSGTMGFHWDVVLVDGFDVTIGDEPIYRDGRLVLLDDPDVRALASEFGDPDEVLRELTVLQR